MDIRSVFINGYGRLRSGWRVAIFLVAFAAVGIILGLATTGVAMSLGFDLREHRAFFLALSGLMSFIPAILIGWLCGKYLEGLPFPALGISRSKGWLKHLSAGLLIGSLSIGLAVLIAWIFGGLSFAADVEHTWRSIAESLFLSLIVFTVAAAFEESLFRGYVLQSLNRAGLGWLAIGVTAVFFGLVHLGNPGAGLVSTTNTMLAGVWFGVAYLKTRDLWFPFGIHFMWNWLQGSFFGIEVSGVTEVSTAPVLTELDRGPAWLTGSSYGIEAGIACTIAIVVSIAVIYFMPGLRPSEEMLAMTGTEKPREEIA